MLMADNGDDEVPDYETMYKERKKAYRAKVGRHLNCAKAHSKSKEYTLYS